MSDFKTRLKELRASIGLSQSALADAIQMSKSSINMYERGEREPGIATLEAIADFFNVDMDYLLGKSDCKNRYLDTLPFSMPRTVSERILERRKQLGLSAEDVAALIGVSPSTVYRYESSEIENMGIDKLEPIANALQTTAAYLMGWVESPTMPRNEFQQKLDALAYDMTDEEKRQLLLAARLIVQQRSEK